MNGSEKKDYVGYEYKEVVVSPDKASLYLDCYENFGWQEDAHFAAAHGRQPITLRLKRDRKMVNKMELTRLQRHFEACVGEIAALEKAKKSMPCAAALTLGLLGTAFMAGSTFAVVHEPPIIWLCILLAIPGFLGWIFPYFLYRKLVITRTRELQPEIEAKYEEIYTICEKGHSLL
ncbi:MAG: hypothetical protein Q4D42_00185 [Eubacteriales bacterium]|nr:hypothetical protein [Eubacteriales bacterium]